ncbi:MAG TPA: sporulation integral membrane protein YtvI [Patescibacteria group bacterium]|jgi:sporulation integral membrane protein YtvI|nr:sporulation integral membrane protein YtvI [Patescibacteria group bacterium]
MLKVDRDRYFGYFIKALIFILVLAAIYLIGKLLITYFAPFLTAIILAMLIEPLVKLFQRFKLGRGLSVILAMILFLGIFVSISAFAITRLVFELKDLYISLPSYYNELYGVTETLIHRATELYLQLTPEATGIIEDLFTNTFEKLKVLLGQMVTQTPSSTITVIGKFTGAFFSTIVTLLATFFFSKDKALILGFIYRQMSPAWQDKIMTLRKDLFMALVGFLKAQMIILSVTFLESYVGLSILGVKYALIFAIIIALVDILPILGTGSVYVPTAILNLLWGNYKIAIYLLVLYGIIVTVRYMIEPKVVGTQLGIHPVVALASIFAGLRIIGVAGVILGPTTVVVIKACQHAKILPRFK